MLQPQRIPVIDGFRFIAVTSVVFYHLTNPSIVHYPHTDFFLHIFKYGYTGVYFFFIISGFVINYSLDNTPAIALFFKNRFWRLFPAMLLCSAVSFIVALLLDDANNYPGARLTRDFLPSLTFTNPQLWKLVFHKPFYWINGSYWTLWVEAQFYLLAAIVYYTSPKKFFRNFFMVAILLAVSKYLQQWGGERYPGAATFFEGWQYGNALFNFTFYAGWFCIGIIFYQLYQKRRFNLFAVLLSMLVLGCLLRDINLYWEISTVMLWTLAVSSVFFLLLIYRPKTLKILENRLVIHVGRISYTVYLVHEVVGTLIINRYYPYLGSMAALAPFIVAGFVLCFATLSHRFFERKLVSCFK